MEERLPACRQAGVRRFYEFSPSPSLSLKEGEETI